MKIWAVANQKGGVGKTTTAVSLAGLLVQRGHTVLAIDMDPHGSLTSYFGYNPEAVADSVYDLFHADGGSDMAALAKQTAVDGLQLVPANPALATLDRQLGIRPSMGLVIGRALKALGSRFDYVVMDCPPMLGILMVNALAACHQLVIPVQTEYLALKGLERMKRTLDMMSRSRGLLIPYLIVPTMFDRRVKEAFRSLEFLQVEYGSSLWRSVIPIDTRFRDASRARLPISYAGAGTRGCRAYTALLETLLYSEQSALLEAASP